MSVANEIQRLQQAKADLKTAIEAKGVTVSSSTTIDGYATLVGQIEGGGGGSSLPATLEVKSTTVHYDATHTENIATNDNIRILGSDNKKYTLAEWNALFVAAGYNKNNMSVTPKGLAVDAFDNAGECYIFNSGFSGKTYTISGETAKANYNLPSGLYNHPLVTAAGSGTDYTTNKSWSVTESGDNLTLSEANTGQSWVIKKNTGSADIHTAFNIEDRTYSIWAQTEWMRHRMAIDSGISTTKSDGTMGEIAIYNSSGAQAAANTDMYFWIKNDSGVWTNTNILAKYNLNNLSGTNSALLTSAIRDAIYGKQKSNGIDMNDTGVNSASKPTLAEGGKGAEVIAKGGKWMIITPYITNTNATTSNALYNVADAPAIYYVKYHGWSLPSDTLLSAMYFNKTIINAVVDYLTNREGWTLGTVLVNGVTASVIRLSKTYILVVNRSAGNVTTTTTGTATYIAGALYIPDSNS